MNKLLVAVYGVFALSASARAAVQIATAFGEAPLAYSLSALAGLVYLVAAIALARRSGRARRIATASILFELVGVLVVGTAGLLYPDAFPDETVWSGYGRGYGFVPLVLPIVGLLWIVRSSRADPPASPPAAPAVRDRPAPR